MPTEKVRMFWDKTRAELDEVEINASVKSVEDPDVFTPDVFTIEGRIKTRTIYREIMSSFQGTKIRAWYTVPAANPPPRGWPAIMEVPGYGGTMPLPSHLSQFGYATLSLFP